MPSFNDKDHDDKTLNILQDAYEREVIPIEAGKFAEKGGIINCVTWNI